VDCSDLVEFGSALHPEFPRSVAEDFALFPAVQEFYAAHPTFPRPPVILPTRALVEGSWGSEDPSLLWLSHAIDDVKNTFIRQQEETGAITQEAALALADFFDAHCRYFESYVHHYHKPYLAPARRLVAQYRSLFGGARSRALSQPRRMDHFISAMMPSLSGYRGELLSLTTLPKVRNFGFHFDDAIGTTKSSLLRETRAFHQKVLTNLPVRLKEALGRASFEAQYPWLSHVIRGETSKQEQYDRILNWITHEKEFDFLLKNDGRFVIVEVKNRKEKVGIKYLTQTRKRSRGLRSKSMLQQFEELVEIQALLKGGSESLQSPLFEVAAHFPNSISDNAAALLESRGIRVIR
jgi:hypothetical protein